MSEMRYWIMDEDETPQRFPLRRLFSKVREVADFRSDTCELTKVRGYGARVHELEERLDEDESVAVPTSMLDELSGGVEEWFYDLDARLPNTDIRFGLHDSTALFVEAAPEIVERVISAFTSTRQAL